ncbi:MAG: hypothetical protein HRF50_04240 [Phycisphaerae bacterium]|jgi:flagellar basal-body rod protein FlgB
MWLDRITTSRTAELVELAARFYEERHKVLAENVANIDTPDHQARTLDPRAFQSELRKAAEKADGGDGGPLALHGEQAWTDGAGRLHVSPAIEPAQNVLFHDGTNARLEALMTDAQANGLQYNLAINLLKGRYNSLLAAVRGRTT